MPVTPWRRAGLVLASFMLVGLTGVGSALAGQTLDRIQSEGQVKVCIWPQFYGVTYRNERSGTLSGMDIDLSRELGRDLGVNVVHVDTSADKVSRDLYAGRCHIGMFALETLRPHKRRLSYSQPYLESDVYGLTSTSSRIVRSWQDIDRPDVVVAVPAGSTIAVFMAARLQDARLLPIRGAEARVRALESGQVDVVLASFPGTLGMMHREEGIRRLAPSEPVLDIPMAYAVKPGDDAWLAVIDAFTARIKADGRLLRAADRHGLACAVVLE